MTVFVLYEGILLGVCILIWVVSLYQIRREAEVKQVGELPCIYHRVVCYSMICFAVSHACQQTLYAVGCEQTVGSGRWVLRNIIDVCFDMGIIIGYYANRLRVWWSIAFLFCIGILFNVTVKNVLDTTYYKFVWTACLMLSLGAALILLWWFLSLLEQHLAESNTLDVYSDRLDTFRHFLVGITLCFSTIILLQIYSLYAGISTPTPYMGQACSVEYFSPFILISASLALHQGWTSNAPLHENGARVHPSKGRLSTAMEQTLFSPDTPASVSGPVVSNLNSDRTAWPDIVPSSAP